MQKPYKQLTRETRDRIPQILADLLGASTGEIQLAESEDSSADLIARDSTGRRFGLRILSSSGPGQLSQVRGEAKAIPNELIEVVVVPFMTPQGAAFADKAGINWIDLSGNALIRKSPLHVRVQGQPNTFRSPGRPSSPFAPRSARVARALLLDPMRWWRQKDLSGFTALDDGSVSRIVRRLDDERLLERSGRELRPLDADQLLAAWAQDYRFDRHDTITAHVSGNGIEVARSLSDGLSALGATHAFTGLAAAWALDQFARFRLTTVYVDGDPREIADQLSVRRVDKGANVQLVGPDDDGVFAGAGEYDGLRCVAPVQVYLDLLHLPERADEAARHLRSRYLQLK